MTETREAVETCFHPASAPDRTRGIQSLQDISRLHASSGTTGKPIVVAYTKEDLEVWTDAIVEPWRPAGPLGTPISYASR